MTAESPASRAPAWLWALVALAVLRLVLFQAAFPPFSQVDEILHWDTVHKYARLELPHGGLPGFDEEVLDQYLLYESKEYAEGGEPAPHPMLAPAELRAIHVEVQKKSWRNAPNYMAWEPPLYYLGAALWVKMGALCGIGGIDLFFWARAFGAVLYGLLILVAAGFVRRYLPGRDFLGLAVPLLLVALPQDLYYQVSDDVPSALLLVLGFDRLLRLNGQGRLRDYVLSGLCFAALLLTKPTNLPTLILPAWFLLPRLVARLRGRPVQADRRDLAFWISLVLPVLGWALYSRLAGGEWLGSRHKMAYHGFIPQGIFSIFEHPGFSFAGFAFFFTGLFSTFWSGEFWWKGKLLAWAWLDLVLSLLLIGMISLSWSGRSRELPALPRSILRPGRWLVLGSVAFLILSSLMLEFPDRPLNQPPSQKEPFFRVYRLISATLFPVLLFFADGMDRLADLTARSPVRWILLGLVVLLLLSCEFWMSRTVFASPYNWFHLPR